MSGYRRFIAYVYEYSQGKKGNGKGFIKVEAREGVCRMHYKLSGIYGQESVPAEIYGYVREKEECKGILLGRCNLAGASAEFELELPETGMGGSDYELGDLCGIILLADSGLLYGSGWDDRPINIKEIRFPGTQAIQEEIKAAEKPETQQSVQSETTQSETTQSETIQPEIIQQESVPERHDEAPLMLGEDCRIFRDNEITDCRRITPEDARALARCDRGLLNNHFLRYGYTQYGHLLLGRREKDNRYILGVPGMYERQEAMMAGMYGFPYFKETKGGQQSDRRFGYWYRLIDTPDAEKREALTK